MSDKLNTTLQLRNEFFTTTTMVMVMVMVVIALKNMTRENGLYPTISSIHRRYCCKQIKLHESLKLFAVHSTLYILMQKAVNTQYIPCS